jgi:hypothetical protein
VGRAPAKPANEVITDPTLAKAANEVITDLGVVRDPVTGKYRRTRLFVMTLGYSRKSVRLLEFRSSSQIWSELQEKAFRRLTGATRVVVLDNLREGVLAPHIYDPTLNPLYRDGWRHYGAVALPCRVADPDRKGKVESGVGHAQKTPLKGLRFESLEERSDLLGSRGSALGGHPDSRHHQAPGGRHVCRRKTGSATSARAAASRGSRSLTSEQRIPSTKDFFQFVVQHFGPRLQEKVSAAQCPVHLLQLGEPPTDHLVDGRFHEGRANATTNVSLPVLRADIG